MAPLWTDCLQTQRSSWCLTGQVPPWFWTHATRFSTLVFCSKGLWATKQPRFWLVWQRESKLLQLLGFLAGIIAGNLLGINSKLISRLKSISSFPAINWTTLTKTDKAGIKFDKIWPFDEDYQYLPIPFIHKPVWLLDCPFHILISKHSVFCTHDYKLPLLPRSSPQEFSTLHFSNASSCPSCAKTSPWHSHLSRKPLPHPNSAPGKQNSRPESQWFLANGWRNVIL